jgi:hypothetical protein
VQPPGSASSPPTAAGATGTWAYTSAGRPIPGPSILAGGS